MFNNWTPSNDSEQPIYEQLADFIKELIKNGTLYDGYKLPSQRTLCEKLNLSRPTISKAFELLEYDHLVKVEGKKRAVISVQAPDEVYEPVDWETYSKQQYHTDNSLVYKDFNILRSESSVVNLFECYFGHDFKPYEPIKEAFQLLNDDFTKLDHRTCFDIRGLLSLRQAICAHLAKDGIHVTPSQVLVCTSLENAYMTVFSTMVSLSSMCYIEEESIFHADSYMNYIKIPLDNEGIKARELKKRINPNRSGVLFLDTDFAMPTGIVHSHNRKKEILQVAYESRLPIIECPAVRDCWHKKPSSPTLKAMDKQGNVIYIFSLARPFVNPLLTALIAPEPIIPSLINSKLIRDEYTDILSQLMMEKLLTEGIYERYMENARPLISQRCSETDKLLHKYFEGIAVWNKPDRGICLRLEFNFDISRAVKDILADGILVYPPELFGSKSNFIWFNYIGLDMDLLDKALANIAFRIKQHMGK